MRESFKHMPVSHQKSLGEKEKKLQILQEIHKDEPKLTEFVSKSIGLHNQLLQQQKVLSEKISQWSYYCERSYKITHQVVELRSDYDLSERQVTDYLTWQDEDEGKRAGAPRINENHKELLFYRWDDQIKEAEKAAEMEATMASILIDSVNENSHRENLIAETTLGYLLNKQRLESEWRQKAEEKQKELQALNRLNWESYWTHLVKPHSQCMTEKCIENVAEKVVPALMDSVFSAKIKAEVSQLTLLKPILDTCRFKD